MDKKPNIDWKPHDKNKKKKDIGLNKSAPYGKGRYGKSGYGSSKSSRLPPSDK